MRITKKAIAIACAVAMVSTGIPYSEISVGAATEYNTLTFKSISAGGITVEYAIVSQLVGQVDPWFGDGGSTFQFIYSGDYKASNISSVKINDEEVSAGGAYVRNDTGCVFFNPTLFENDAYTNIKVEYNNGADVLEAVIKRGNPAGGTEVTTVAGETTQAEETTISNAKDWIALGIGAEGVPADTYFYDKNSVVNAEVINIQAPDFAPEPGVYIAVAAGIVDVSVNGVASEKGINGAGVVVPLSLLTEAENEIVINYAGGTGKAVIKNASVGGEETTVAGEVTTSSEETTAAGEVTTQAEETTNSNVKNWEALGVGAEGVPADTYYYDKNSVVNAEVINIQAPNFAPEPGVYIVVGAGITDVLVNGQALGAGIDGAGVVVPLSLLTKAENEVVINYAGGTGKAVIKNASVGGEETTTGAGEETTAPEETTEATGQMTQAPANWSTHGNWDIYFGDWAGTGEYQEIDKNTIKINRTNVTNWDKWGTQVRVQILSGITVGETYTFTCTLKADGTDGTISFDTNPVPLTGELQTITLTAEATELEGFGPFLEFGMPLGNVGMNVPMTFANPVVKDSQGNVIYPASEIETTVPESTTQKPSTKPTEKPTVKPTVKVDPIVKTQVKIAKVAPKKKAAKKITITLKSKIKGAKGYAVRVYKTKKAAKKNANASAFVKVTTKKNLKKFTVTSKKLVNKKTLYVRVRAYKVVKGKKIYSNKWSNIVKVRIKK